jgi:hypothetical protein
MTSRSSTSISKALLVLCLCAGVAHAGGRKRIVVLDFDGPKADKIHDDLVRLIKKSHTVVSTEKWTGAAEQLDAGSVTDKNIKKVAKKLKVDGVVTGTIEKRRDEYLIKLQLRAGTSGETVGQRVNTKSDGPRLDNKSQRDIKDELLAAIDELEANHGGGGGGDDEADDKPAKKKVAAKDDDDDPKPAKKDKAKKPAKDDDAEDDAKPPKKGFSKKFDKGSDADEEETLSSAHGKPGKKDKDADKKKPAKGDDDEADNKPAKKDKDADKKKPAKADHADEETSAALSTKHDDDESPLPKAAKKDKKSAKADDDKKPAKTDDEATSDDDDKKAKKKKVAKKGDEDEEASAEAEVEPATDLATQLSVGQRAIDATVGFAVLLTRKLSYDYAPALTGTQVPPHYGSTPSPGAMFDVTAYPLAFGHKRKGPLTGLGLELGYERILLIISQKAYGPVGQQKIANLTTTSSQFAVAAVFRYPLGPAANAPVIGGKLGYIGQSFTIQQTTPDGMSTDLPNVSYSIIAPTVFGRYTLMPKLVVGADLSLLLVSGAGTGAGDIGSSAYYGQASVSGFAGALTGEYQLTTRIFARAVFDVQAINFTFSKDPTKAGMQVFNRDSDPTTQDVFGAHDLYLGLSGVIGFAY